MPRRRSTPAVSLGTEIAIDAISTVIVAVLFHVLFDMPWLLAFVIAAPASIVGWWCLLHLERDSSGGWDIDL